MRRATRGFTLMEILVVMSIIVMAAGILIPSLAEFMRNQRLKGLGGKISSALVWARNEAVTKRVTVRVVFLRYGVWLYTERYGFTESGYRRVVPRGAENRVWIRLHFAGITTRDAAERLPRRRGEPPSATEIREKQGWVFEPAGGEIPADAIVLVFSRDGTVDFRGASPGDRPTSLFLKDHPVDADIVVEELGNQNMAFIDIRPSGGIRLRIDVPDESLVGARGT